MFDRLTLVFYSADSIDNCGVFISYDRESISNACNFFCNFVLLRYQVIIMICKHGAVSRSQLYSQ